MLTMTMIPRRRFRLSQHRAGRAIPECKYCGLGGRFVYRPVGGRNSGPWCSKSCHDAFQG